MKKKQFTEEQIIKILNRFKNGMRAEDLARECGVTPTTIYHWRKKYSDMTVSEAKKMRELESENTKLKKIVADMALDIAMLKEVNSRKW